MTSIHPTQDSLIPGQPPSAQEIQRKLSVAQRKGKSRATVAQNSGTDTEDEASMISPNDANSVPMGVSASQPLSAIAERTVSGAEESEEDEDDVAGGWRPAKSVGALTGTGHTITVLHSGYLWKKGSGRRKTWKKRWFVLRPTNLACYKTSAEYKLMRLLDVSDIHAATPVQLKRHPNACGIVTQGRTFYFQADTSTEIDQWVLKINAAKEALHTTSVPGTPTITPPSAAAVEPGSKAETSASQKPATTISLAIPPTSPTVIFTEPSSPISAVASPSRNRNAQASNTSSDSDEGTMSASNMKSPRSPSREASGSKDKDMKDLGKPVLSGYLMKCGGRRKIWRKRWFILTQTKLVYMGSHMDTKPHRQIMLNQILDAMEYRPAPANHNHNRHASPNRGPGDPGSSVIASSGENASTQKGSTQGQAFNSNAQQTPVEPYLVSGVNYTFKVFTPKKTFLLCAPSEEEEVSWISAIRVLIARRTKEKEAETAGGAHEEGKKTSSKPAATPRTAPETPATGAQKSSVAAVTA